MSDILDNAINNANQNESNQNVNDNQDTSNNQTTNNNQTNNMGPTEGGNVDNNQTTDGRETVNIGGKEYSIEELESILSKREGNIESEDDFQDDSDDIEALISQLEKEINDVKNDNNKTNDEKIEIIKKLADEVKSLKDQLNGLTQKNLNIEAEKEINEVMKNFNNFINDRKDLEDLIKFSIEKTNLSLSDYAKIKFFDELMKAYLSNDVKFNKGLRQTINKTEQARKEFLDLLGVK